MAKHLVQLVLAGAQVVGRAFARAVRQEITMSQEAAKRNADAKGEQEYRERNESKGEMRLWLHLLVCVSFQLPVVGLVLQRRQRWV